MKCPICGDEFTPKRKDAKTCGEDSCRKALQRMKKRLPDRIEEGSIKIAPAFKKVLACKNGHPLPPDRDRCLVPKCKYSVYS